jgi:putative SOS response-associated peptidase YedK
MPHFNAARTQSLPVVRTEESGRRLKNLRWGAEPDAPLPRPYHSFWNHRLATQASALNQMHCDAIGATQNPARF